VSSGLRSNLILEAIVSGTRWTAGERARHWNAAYATRSPEELSWHQDDAVISLELIDTLAISRDAAIVDVGGGASVFAATLLARGFSDVTVLDLSVKALAEAQRRAGAGTPIKWLHEDLLRWRPERRYDVWHDRAVLHFLVDEADRDRYLETLRYALKEGGAVVLGVFAADGPVRCSGLAVTRYSAADLAALLGAEFDLVAIRREEHISPAAVMQPFTWVAGRRIDARYRESAGSADQA
jgi:2-polyprenyl-3-methyl-5-hydroxy-6-metoxy-1,4-benzoquinol methylase